MAQRGGGAADPPYSQLLRSNDVLKQRVVAIYGSSSETVDAAAGAIVQRLRSGSARPLTYEQVVATDIAQDLARLFDHFAANSLFGDAVLLRIDNVTETHAKVFRPFFTDSDANDSENLLVMTSADLRRSSGLLQDIRKYPKSIVVAAYENELSGDAIQQMAAAHGLAQLTPHVLQRLSDYAAATGPVLLDVALAKLSLAADLSGKLSDDDAEATLPETSAAGSDEIAERLFEGDHAKLLAHLDQIRAEGEADARFVAQLARLCLDVKRSLPNHSAGKQRPLFWKTEKVVRKAQNNLPRFADRVERALKEIHHVETKLRSSEPLAPLATERLCLRLARCFTPAAR